VERFTGRKWEVTVGTASEARQQHEEAGTADKQRKQTAKDKADDRFPSTAYSCSNSSCICGGGE
jgi:hypothetical protein